MKRISFILMAVSIIFTGSNPSGFAQSRIAKEQIEDAFLLKTGGSVYGDLSAATSSLKASTLALQSENGFFELFKDDSSAVIRSNIDLYLDPTANGTSGSKIIPATVIEFPDYLGEKIRFYSHAYNISVSPMDLDITSDRNIKFHSDTVSNLMVVWGDQGDVQAKNDLRAGNNVLSNGVFSFMAQTEGDKFLLYGTLYRLAISSGALDFYSDNQFKWHTDTVSDVMQLEGDTGRLSLSGPLKLPIYSSLPSAATGEVIYLDHTTDNTQDGLYIRCATDWQKCN